jgi:hypothetical protein
LITSTVNTEQELFLVDISIPEASFGKYKFQDFEFHGKGDLDSLRVTAGRGQVTVNDSLQFPSTAINIVAAGDISDINVTTSANQAINAATLSVKITHLEDGIRIKFNPSSIVLNEKNMEIR